MKGKVLAGLILTGVICFSGTAFAARTVNVPKDSTNPPAPPEWNGQPPADNQRPPMPPKHGSFDKKPPLPPKHGSFDRKPPQFKK